MKIVQFDGDKHLNFILNSWLKSGKSGFEFNESTRNDYYGFMEPYIKSVLQLPETECSVAVDAEDDSNYIGYIVASLVGDNAIYLHYIYVKQAFRQFGVAKELGKPVIDTGRMIYYTTIPTQWRWQYAKDHRWKYDKMHILNRIFGGNCGTI